MKKVMPKTVPFVLLCLIFAGSVAAEFSWQEPQAKVLRHGDLEWAPRPFVFEVGETVRYIDFENGKDSNTGTSSSSPWKHHPWDANASGKAKSSNEVDTYIFKKGVQYRGVLISKESGTPETPIRLTSDPAWGEGAAVLCGSEKISGGWKKCTKNDVPEGMPNPKKVWRTEVEAKDVSTLWEIRNDKIVRIPIAREPNWTITDPDHIMKDWWEWTETGKLGGEMKLPPWKKRQGLTGEELVGYTPIAVDANHITTEDPAYYDGGRIWSTYDGNMGTPTAYEITRNDLGTKVGLVKYNPEFKGFDGIINPQPGFTVGGLYDGAKYFMENLPYYLDVPGEYYFKKADAASGTLFLRLPDDRDPNESLIEIGTVPHMINILNNSHIVISGLEFNFNSPTKTWGKWPVAKSKAAAIRIIGDVQHVVVKNCVFRHVMGGVVGYPRLSPPMHHNYSGGDIIPRTDGTEDLWDENSILDNDFSHIDGGTLFFTDAYLGAKDQEEGAGELGMIHILRNRFYLVGHRQYESVYASVAAIGIRSATLCEVAGNMVNRSAGPGVWIYIGKSLPSPKSSPLLRVLVHHNKIENSCLFNNDWGGIESWYGGPTYIFDNISYNAIGPRNAVFYNKRVKNNNRMYDDWACNAYAYYLDHGYKNYLFNNIAAGKSNDRTTDIRNRAGGIMVHGFLNHWFNNTFDNFLHGITGSAGEYNYLLGNLFTRINGNAFKQNAAGDYSLAGGGATGDGHESALSKLAYKNNVFDRVDAIGGPLRQLKKNGRWVKDFSTLQQHIEETHKPLSAQFGEKAGRPVLEREETFHFRPEKDFAGKELGCRFFVPWSLYATVGEWNFRLYNADPTRILGENYNMTDEYIDAKVYEEIPRNHLTAPNATADDFIVTDLDNWHPSALVFDGKQQFLVVTHEEIYSDYPVTSVYSEETTPDLKRKRLTGKDLMYPGEKRRTVNMDTNSFILELYFKTDDAGTLISKTDGKNGYQLIVNDDGTTELSLISKGRKNSVSGGVLDDGDWHHLLVEVDRAADTATLFVDGKKEADKTLNLSEEVSFANESDFFVGKQEEGDFFAGAIDFLRVARGSLKDSRTTIEELYEWEFNGPQYSDFSGAKIPVGKRDAGAVQAK